MEDSPVQFQENGIEPEDGQPENSDRRKRILIAAAVTLVLVVSLWALWKSQKAYDKAKSASASVEAVQNDSQEQLLRDTERIQKEIRSSNAKVQSSSRSLQGEINKLEKKVQTLAKEQTEADRVNLRAVRQINRELDAMESRVLNLENQVRRLQEQS